MEKCKLKGEDLTNVAVLHLRQSVSSWKAEWILAYA